ncbi:hypothetical protein [Bartonella sp. OT172YNZD]|uniref:hypothetical protein n=1 Tax=Bartonella sp. OT172YNZD TaxID=3243572 RepID=UPI0035CF3630
MARHEKDEKNNSKITHLDGDISEGSTEAITGNQIYSLKSQFAAYFGSGASYGKKGKWIAPEFKIQAFNKDDMKGKKSYNDVANAFEGVNESMSNINDRIKDVEENVSSNSLNWDEKRRSV